MTYLARFEIDGGEGRPSNFATSDPTDAYLVDVAASMPVVSLNGLDEESCTGSL
jgi:hypothetical protein